MVQSLEYNLDMAQCCIVHPLLTQPQEYLKLLKYENDELNFSYGFIKNIILTLSWQYNYEYYVYSIYFHFELYYLIYGHFFFNLSRCFSVILPVKLYTAGPLDFCKELTDTPII